MAAAVAPDNDSMTRLASELSTAMDHLEGSGIEKELNSYYNDSDLRLGSPPSTLAQRQEGSSALPAEAQRTTSSSPVDQFTTPVSHSPQGSTDLDHLPSSEFADTSQTTNATSMASDGKTSARKRSSSGAGVLARLTSRNSFIGLDRILTNNSSTGQSASTETESPTKPKIDKAALARSKSKYKSGVNWDNPDFANAEEPFEASSSPIEERKMDYTEPKEDVDLQALASAGGTKAALAQNRASTIGVGAAYFPAAQRAAIEASQAAQFAAMQSPAPRLLGSRTPRGQDSRSPESLSPVQSTNHGETGNSSRISADGQKYTAEQAQRILQSARDAVVMSNAASMRSPAVQNGQSVDSAPVVEKPANDDSLQVKEESTANKKKARKSFMGFGLAKDKKSKEPKSSTTKTKDLEKSTSKTNLTATEQGAKLASVKSESGSDTSPKQEGTNSPSDNANATAGRRRRFNDTRELNLVASQLAAEALLPPSADHSRHTSMMGVLSQNGGHQHDGSNGSLPAVASSSNAAGFSMPQPAFANEARSTSYASSPVNGSPRMQASEISRYEQPRAAFARSTHSTSSLPGSPSLTQSAKLSGLPSDMLTGLNDGPYPHLPPRSYDLSDPFGVPTMPSDFDIPSINLGGRNSLPNTSSPFRSRGMSSGSAGRRSVLQMSMHNPDQESQGLTKKPKSGKSTPFGSRAPSRQPTPKSSKTNLREAAREDVGKSSAPAALVASSQTVESTTPPKKTEALNSQDNLKPAVQKTSRFSMMGMKKNKSTTELNKNAIAKEIQQLKPPSNNNITSSTSNFGGSSDRHSASNDSTISRLQQDGNEARSASISAQSLVKVPSPTSSGSSHERSAMGSASDGSNSYRNIITSTATTPEVPISKADIFSSSQTQGISSPLVAALGDTLHQSNDQQPTPKQSTQNLSNGHPKASVVTSAPVQTTTPIYQALATSTDSKQEKMSNISLTPQTSNKAVPSASPAKSTNKAGRPSLMKLKSNTGGGKSKVGKFISKFGASRDGKQTSIPASKSQTHLPTHHQSIPPPLPTSANEKSANKYATVNGKMNASKDNLNTEKGKVQSKFGQFRANIRNDWMA